MSTSDQIRNLHNDGRTTKEIASILNIRYQHVYGVLKKDGNTPKPSNQQPKPEKRGELIVDGQVTEFLRQTTFPTWWIVKKLEGNRWSAHCQKKLFHHHTQEWSDLGTVIEEATMMVKDGECRCV